MYKKLSHFVKLRIPTKTGTNFIHGVIYKKPPIGSLERLLLFYFLDWWKLKSLYLVRNRKIRTQSIPFTNDNP
jgi:hypothetical protein